MAMTTSPATAEADTRAWLERAVIGLNLCPFAKAVYVRDQVHLVVSPALDAAGVREALRRELLALHGLPPQVRDTTLLVVPDAFDDFLVFNDFLDQVDEELETLDLHGILQVASFHPRYQFAGTDMDDMGNFTNRSPYPTLHLLRESSIDRAVESFPDAEAIFGRNIERLEQLGLAGWNALDVGASSPETGA
jgi:hypothetical protein